MLPFHARTELRTGGCTTTVDTMRSDADWKVYVQRMEERKENFQEHVHFLARDLPIRRGHSVIGINLGQFETHGPGGHGHVHLASREVWMAKRRSIWHATGGCVLMQAIFSRLNTLKDSRTTIKASFMRTKMASALVLCSRKRKAPGQGSGKEEVDADWSDAELMRGKVLCVDGLNFAGNSFGFVIGRGREWNVNTPLEKVESFVAAAKRAGVESVVFIDAGTVKQLKNG